MRDHANSNRTASNRTAREPATGADPSAGNPSADNQSAGAHIDTDPSTTERLDEALACLRTYGRQSAVDISQLETAIRRVRSRIASRATEPTPETVDA